MEITFPLFVRLKDSGEICCLNSVYELQYQFEKIDVENQEFEAWDKNGVPVRLESQQPVWIKLIPSQVADFEGLRAAIRQFAESEGAETGDMQGPETAEALVDYITAEQEKKKLAKSPIRRFVSGLRATKTPRT
jgi:hypothetical protein